MKVFPLQSMSLSEAKEMQFKIIDEICQEFEGHEILTQGDLGVNARYNEPLFTNKVERVLAKIFNAPRACLVVGAGTGAIRYGLYSLVQNSSCQKILVHDAPIYPTTITTLKMFELEIIAANFNDLNDLNSVLNLHPELEMALVQVTRQTINDSYDLATVLQTIKKNHPKIKIITNDNYAVFKIKQIGVQLGANLSTFSAFKISGPEGVGVILGDEELINNIKKENYSGGSQVQGHQAFNLLKGLVACPVNFAIQSEVTEEIVRQLKIENLKIITDIFIANAQSKVIIVKFSLPIAKQVLQYPNKLGALPNPLGAESKYEFCPLFYRVSATFNATIPLAQDYMIRINPNRAGASTVIRILKECLKNVFKENN